MVGKKEPSTQSIQTTIARVRRHPSSRRTVFHFGSSGSNIFAPGAPPNYLLCVMTHNTAIAVMHHSSLASIARGSAGSNYDAGGDARRHYLYVLSVFVRACGWLLFRVLSYKLSVVSWFAWLRILKYEPRNYTKSHEATRLRTLTGPIN